MSNVPKSIIPYSFANSATIQARQAKEVNKPPETMVFFLTRVFIFFLKFINCLDGSINDWLWRDQYAN